jgi:hypothetical protein
MQLPDPSQVGAASVTPLPGHDGLPHVVWGDISSHTPPAAQMPVLPQGPLAKHCPDGAVSPGR